MAADRSVLVRLKADIGQFQRAMAEASTSTSLFAKKIEGADRVNTQAANSLDRLSGRVRLFTEGLTAIGPAVLPLSAAAVPALTGLAAGFGAAAAAAGVALMAFNGVGDGLKALNAYQLERTPENLDKVREAFAALGPDGAEFIRFLDDLEPKFRALQMTGRANMFPGVEAGMTELLDLFPQVQRVVANVAAELGDLSQEAGEALSGDRFSAFFNYIETEAAPTLSTFAHSIGNVVEGLASLTVAFAPLSRDFSMGLEDMTQSFADWAAGVSQTQGFHDFVDYIRTSGPQAIDLLGAVSVALVQIAQAAAPVGQVVLPILTSLARVLSAIADSPIGTPLFTAAAGFVALSRATKILGPGLGSLNEAFLDLRTSPNVAATAVERFGRAARAASGAAGMGLLVTSLSETDRALSAFEGAAGGALAGLAVGGPWGAAVGGAIGLVVSLGQAHDHTAAEVDELTSTFDRQTGAITENTRAVAVQKLQQEGLLDAAQQLGLSTSLVTDAVLGNAGAQRLLNAALAGYEVDTSITSVDDLRKSYSEAEIATILQERAATKLKNALPGLASVFAEAGADAKQFAGAMGDTGEASGRMAEGLARARAAARQTAQSFITLGDSLDDSKVSLGEWIQQMARQAEALRDFARNSLAAARRGLDQGLIKSLQEAGTEGALRMRQLANASESEIGRANRAWRAGRQAADTYAEAVARISRTHARPTVELDISPAEAHAARVRRELAALTGTTATPKVDADNSSARQKTNAVDQWLRELTGTTARPKVTAETSAAEANIRAVQYALNALHDKTVTINTVRMTSFLSKRAGMPQAGGGFVPKTGLSYADRHPYLLADGEGITTNRHGETDRFRDVISGINAGLTRNQVKGMLADGGIVGRSSNGSGSGNGDSKQEDARRQRRHARLEKLLKGQEKLLEDQKSDRQKWVQAAQELRSSVRDGLRSDLFARPDNPWAADATANPTGVLKGDIARIHRFMAAVRKLHGKGVDGPALSAIITEGGLEGLEMMAQLPRAQLREYEQLFGRRERLLRSAGSVATSAVGINRHIRDLRHDIHETRDELRHIKQAIKDADRHNQDGHEKAADRVGDKIKGNAQAGHRRGVART